MVITIASQIVCVVYITTMFRMVVLKSFEYIVKFLRNTIRRMFNMTSKYANNRSGKPLVTFLTNKKHVNVSKITCLDNKVYLHFKVPIH